MFALHGSANMICHILVTVFFFGFALLLGILSVVRGLYALSIFQPPLIPSDPAAMVSLNHGHERSRVSAANPAEVNRVLREVRVIPRGEPKS
jgi:hypothetical protein